MRGLKSCWYVCSKCRGWEWARKPACHQCSTPAPKWAQQMAAAAAVSPPNSPDANARRRNGRRNGNREQAEAAEGRAQQEADPTAQDKDKDKWTRTRLQRDCANWKRASGCWRKLARRQSWRGYRKQYKRRGHNSESKHQKLAKLQQQQQQARGQLAGLEAELQGDIDKLRQQYISKRVGLELEIAKLEEQSASAAESMSELKEQQTKLVADGPVEGQVDTELDNFCTVLAKLSSKDPTHTALFEEVNAFARRALARDEQPKPKQSGAGVWDTQTVGDHMDIDVVVVVDEAPTPVDNTCVRAPPEQSGRREVEQTTPVEPGQQILPWGKSMGVEPPAHRGEERSALGSIHWGAAVASGNVWSEREQTSSGWDAQWGSVEGTMAAGSSELGMHESWGAERKSSKAQRSASDDW
eukprot:4458416-Amphidinium_carterae.1